MKKKLLILILFLVSYYFIDHEIFMKKRVSKHIIWEHNYGEKIRGDFIDIKDIKFNGDIQIRR